MSLFHKVRLAAAANRAKNIQNIARINEDIDQKALLRKYERELKRLRAELEQRKTAVVDQRKLLLLEEERRRADRDRLHVFRDLDARNQQLMSEKAEKQKLEGRIADLQSQLLTGTGHDEAGGGPDKEGLKMQCAFTLPKPDACRVQESGLICSHAVCSHAGVRPDR